MLAKICAVKCIVVFAIATSAVAGAAEAETEPQWRPLPLISDGKVDEGWRQVGWGGFAVDDGVLRTEGDPRGLGVLVYEKERLGNCEIRIVYKCQDARSNAGIFVRMADGILDQVGRNGAAFDRNGGNISDASMKAMRESSDREEGPWFAVHNGYEVQIMDAANDLHRTGAIYSLGASSAISTQTPVEWRTMLITLAGSRILVDLDGTRVTDFDPSLPDGPLERQWYEPKRETKRPEVGYIGLQNHDPGDVVWFREISVRPLTSERAGSLGGRPRSPAP